MVLFLNPSLEKVGKAISCTPRKATHSFALPWFTSCHNQLPEPFCVGVFGELRGRAVEGVLEKVCVLLLWQKIWTQEPSLAILAHKQNLESGLALSERSCFQAIGWRKRLVAKCQQVPVNIYKCLIHSLLYARGSRRKMRSGLVCGRGKKIVSRGWLYHWKEEMRVRVKEGEGKRGEQERFPKLIKCSEGRKLPASIPVPLDKLAHCSLQLLCSAEVASWGHHQRVRGMVGAINSECFCARWLLFILQSCFVGDLLLKLRARAANYHFSACTI